MGAKLGQHFLKNQEKIKKIVSALDIHDGETIIEIGPGHGELTGELESRIQNLESRIIAIEKDKTLSAELQKRFKDDKKIKIIEGDVLKIIPNFSRFYSLDSSSYKLVGNIPYYLTGKLLRLISEMKDLPSFTVLTIQKEVALRITAKPPKMNILAAAVQFWAEPEIIDFIDKKSFEPQPKVDSAIIRLKTTEINREIASNYYQLIKILFRQPRKTVINNLKNYPFLDNKPNLVALKNKLASVNILENARPQNISINAIKTLSLILYNE
ncbi:MAG: 16S rRNA (adenine(1518)-N(6)/adenine(1519)-N(6))-dimethyltransferase RsmA [Patescibacteria group bacterium]